MRGRLSILLAVGALGLVGCGNDGGCLTPQEIDDRVDEIALGIEGSEEEVEAKQDEIREVRARACD